MSSHRARWFGAAAAALGAVVFFACRDAVAPPTATEAPMAPAEQIRDAVHSGGNPHFYFLPPAVPQPAYSGTFDPTLSPSVEICVANASGCTASPFVTFTTAGDGARAVRMDAASQQYIVNWKTSDFDLVSGQSYRIVVRAAKTMLGYADVQVYGTQKELKNAITQEAIALLDDRTLPIKFRIEEGAAFVLGKEGGKLEAAEKKVALELPAGALAEPVAITVLKNPALPADAGLVGGAVYDVGPDGTVFGVPVEVAIKYDPSQLPADVPESELTLLTTDVTGTKWEDVPGASVDLATHTVKGSVTHLSGKAPGAKQTEIAISPATSTIVSGKTVQLTATGTPATTRPIQWSSSNASVAAVDSRTGLVTAGTSTGEATITATCSTRCTAGTATVVVGKPVAKVVVTPASATIGKTAPANTVQLAAALTDASGALLEGRDVVWTTSDKTIATVDANGLVTGLAGGTADIKASSEGVGGTARITVGKFVIATDPSFGGKPVTVKADALSTWTLRVKIFEAGGASLDRVDISPPRDARTGAALAGIGMALAELSHGVYELTLTSMKVATKGSGPLDVVFDISAANADPIPFRFVVEFPAVVEKPSVPSDLSAGFWHTCTVMNRGEAYCWGRGSDGQLGTGSNESSLVPVRVATDQSLQVVSAGGFHSCALTAESKAMCWGDNAQGQLGTGSYEPSSVPAFVAGDGTYQYISTSDTHTCALDLAGQAYCWGYNLYGGLGDGTHTTRTVPTPVAGGLTFRMIGVGSGFTCGLAVENKVYCWGWNGPGSLGDGTFEDRALPTPVAGDQTFEFVGVSRMHSCATTPDWRAFCWGSNAMGELGEGTGVNQNQPSPVPVQGDHQFQTVSFGSIDDFSCGTEAGTGVAWCWGYNVEGQLGAGYAGGASWALLPVVGGHTFNFITGSVAAACGIANGEAKVYCWGDNHEGQLGNGTTVNASEPQAVSLPGIP